MYLLDMKTLLTLSSFVEHSVLLSQNRLQRWEIDMRGRVIFVSHQWLGYRSPDPNGVHFSTLKRVLERLMHGEIRKVKTLFKKFLHDFQEVVVYREQWKKALPGMFVWVDYCCMPQVNEEGGLTQWKQAAAAVQSLPSYVERCDLMLILTPVCMHADHDGPCNYASWRTRGWCRLELLFGLLAPHKINIMVCKGAESQPEFIMPFDCMRLQVGTGNFTCCEQGHQLADGKTFPCDKLRVRGVLEDMLDAKSRHLASLGEKHDQRYFAMLRHHFFKGLPESTTLQGQGPRRSKEFYNLVSRRVTASTKTGLSALKDQLNWNREDDRDAGSTGATLLLWACVADDLASVRELLESCDEDAIDISVQEDRPHLPGWLRGLTPLMAAMSFGSPPTVKALLEAKSNPMLHLPPSREFESLPGKDALQLACYCKNMDNVRYWLTQFPKWDVNQEGSIFSLPALAYVAFNGGESSAPIMRELLHARADLDRDFAMGSTLGTIVTWKEDSDPAAMEFLVEAMGPGIVNQQHVPTRRKWSTIFKICRLLARMNVSSNASELARWEGSTPLHASARRGDVVMIRLLLAKRADTQVKNRQGLTPLDVAKLEFGGEVPSILDELLSQKEPQPKRIHIFCCSVPEGVDSPCRTHSSTFGMTPELGETR